MDLNKEKHIDMCEWAQRTCWQMAYEGAAGAEAHDDFKALHGSGDEWKLVCSHCCQLSRGAIIVHHYHYMHVPVCEHYQ
jgi:hypothetical protein